MLGMTFDKNRDQGIKILCLGAHCDDIEIGCGGTLLKILQYFPRTEVHWVVFSSDSRREKEAISCANLFLKHARKTSILINKFRDGFFPYAGGDIKKFFEKLKSIHIPDLILTHNREDLHQDHKTISELTWNTFRNHFILEYEIPKYDGDFRTPSVYVPLEFQVCDYKVRKIIEYFKTQANKHWLTEDLLLSILRIRGMECCSSTGYAEAFYCRKIVFDI